ncbi:MAG: response regulator [Myxococcales bacterium]|nr:response regulator [Myxococcales bacterium]
MVMKGAKTVLLVEDDEDIASLVVLLLDELGYNVERAANGREALATLERGLPHLILLDMKMPVMNGWAFAAEFRARHQRGAPVVVFSAADDAAKRAEEIDADGWIGKPFEFEDFRSLIRRWLEPRE